MVNVLMFFDAYKILITKKKKTQNNKKSKSTQTKVKMNARSDQV